MRPTDRSTEADLSKSLDELDGIPAADLSDAPTQLVRDILRARAKPLRDLSDSEIGKLIVQMEGLPWLLDLVFPKLRINPLFDADYYPGDVLSNLIRAEDQIWNDRPRYREELPVLYSRALDAPFGENDGFIESLKTLPPIRIKELGLTPPLAN